MRVIKLLSHQKYTIPFGLSLLIMALLFTGKALGDSPGCV